jgi:predicted tellurium resistance membrane protein TerC
MTMSLAADLMILIGAILLTVGTDLVINTASTQSAVGAPLGVIVSVLGTTLLTSGILINRRRARRQAQEPPAPTH